MDRRTRLPVHSLYGATRKPTPAMLKGLDALVYDLQDTGVRSYTFISTMGMAMEACAEAGIEFLVLDRPNPLGGERVEGPMTDERFRSFVIGPSTRSPPRGFGRSSTRNSMPASAHASIAIPIVLMN